MTVKYSVMNHKLVKNLPKYYYKYQKVEDFERFKNNLKNAELYFTRPEEFNDIFECKAIIDCGNVNELWDNIDKLFLSYGLPKISDSNKKLLDSLGVKSKKKQEIFNYHLSDLYHKALRNIGVQCFSENGRNLLMWAHYASSHKGVLLKFQKLTGGKLCSKLHKVEYKGSPIIELSGNTFETNIQTQLVTRKGRIWRYERELRAIEFNGEGLYPYNRDELCEVIFGWKTDPNHKISINEIIESDYNNVKLKQAIPIKGRYSLKYENLTKYHLENQVSDSLPFLIAPQNASLHSELLIQT